MDCPSLIPDINYGDFSKRLHQAVVRNRIPVGGSIDLTNRCNLRCVHCYINDSKSQDELNTGELTGILDEIADEGCLWMLFSGGEPLLRKDFRDIYLHAKKRGFLINLFTNATLITEDIADYLADWRPFAVEVSLYGLSEETYASVTGVKGAFERCMQGIEMMRERDIPLRLKSMILTLNKHELEGMIEFARERDVEFRYDTNIHARVDGSDDPNRYRLEPMEVIKMDYADKRRIKALRQFVDYASKAKLNKKHVFHCGGGLNSFHIGADGLLYLCMMYRKQGYNLRKGSFADGWNDFIPGIRYREIEGEYRCSQCEHFFLCGQCPGWGQLENGDELKASDFLCRLAHLRADVFTDEPLWQTEIS